MARFFGYCVGLAVVLATGGATLAAQPHVEVIRVLKDCQGVLPPACYEDSASSTNALGRVIQELHHPQAGRDYPSESYQVVVDIGPGVFELDLSDTDVFPNGAVGYCDGTEAGRPLSHLEFKGAGKDLTVLSGGGYPQNFLNGSNFAMLIQGCTEVTVSELEIRAIDGGTTELGDPVGVQSGVLFLGDGESYWRDMRIRASGMAWYDALSSAIDESVHNWWNSELTVEYFNACATLFASVIYGTRSSHSIHDSQLTFHADALDSGSPCGLPGSYGFATVYLSGGFDLEMFNSEVTYLTADPDGGQVESVYTGQTACGGSEVNSKVHGRNNTLAVRPPGGMSAQAQTPVALRTCGGSINLQETTYDLVGTGQASRILIQGGQPSIHPQFNGSGTQPPTIEPTANGSETFIETDCDSSRCDDLLPGSEHHFLSSDASCGGGAGFWFDNTVDTCRGS